MKQNKWIRKNLILKVRTNSTFYIQFSKNYFSKGDIVLLNGGMAKAVILKVPHKKWYKLILQFISFGFYKAPLVKYYKLKLITS